MAGSRMMFQSGLTTDALNSACAFPAATRLNRLGHRTYCSVSSSHISSGTPHSLSFVRLGTLHARCDMALGKAMATPPRFHSRTAASGGSIDNPSSSNGESNSGFHTVLGYVISIIKGIIGLIGRIPRLLSSILSKQKDVIEDIGDSLEGVADAAEELVKGIAEVARVVEKAADTMADSAEEAQDLLSKITGDDNNGIADLARAIEHAADSLADSAEEANALLDKVEAQAKDIKEDVITAVETLEDRLKPLQEAVKESSLETQNVEVNICLEKDVPTGDGKMVVEKVDAKVTIEKVPNANTAPENESVGKERVRTTVTVTQPEAEEPQHVPPLCLRCIPLPTTNQIAKASWSCSPGHTLMLQKSTRCSNSLSDFPSMMSWG